MDVQTERSRWENERRSLERRCGDAEARSEAVLRRLKNEGEADKLKLGESRHMLLEEMSDQVGLLIHAQQCKPMLL